MKFRVGSLFSGIGGIELGLENTGMFETVWFCDNNAYTNEVLKQHWPKVPNLGDITKVRWENVQRVDVLTGGFPCQDVSMAGKRKGLKQDTRTGLWFHFAEAIRVLRPRFVLCENVAGLLIATGYEQAAICTVLAQLSSLGYDAEWQVISARELGAPHRRDRIFIVAYPNSCGHNSERYEQDELESENTQERKIEGVQSEGRKLELETRQPCSITNPDCKRCVQCKSKEQSTKKRFDALGKFESSSDDVADTDCWDVEAYRKCREERKIHSSGKDQSCKNCKTTTNTERERLERKNTKRRNASEYPAAWKEPTESPICGMDDGIFKRLDSFVWRERIKSLGNAVVPACAEEAARRMIIPKICGGS